MLRTGFAARITFAGLCALTTLPALPGVPGTLPGAGQTPSQHEDFKLIADDAASGDSFGISVAIDGNTVLVGARGDDHGDITNAGSAYLFDATTGQQLHKLTVEDGTHGRFTATCVSTGNPHAVIFLHSADAFDDTRQKLATLGPALEHHRAFPQRANIHFVHVTSPSHAQVLHWERGSGATLACGTGAAAVCVAGILTGRTQRQLTTALPGGELQLQWRESDQHVFMTGPATETYQGVWPD